MSPRFLPSCRPALSALLCLVLLAGCGGAGEMGSGGTGAAASTAEGTVTGFGSIYVDGVRFDDSSATVSSDAADGTAPIAETKLGQRVEVGFAVDGVAQTVKVEPEVLGVVGDLVAGGFTVLGQTVLVNSNPAAGPVTQLEGYAALTAIRRGDLVEVHGVGNMAPGSGFIQATRVEKRASLDYLRVAGLVNALVRGAGRTTFMLGAITVDASSAVIVPPGRELQFGQSVVVFARIDALNGPTLTATRVRIRERIVGPLPGYLGGVISNLAGDANSFSLGPVLVTRGPATRLEPANGTLANGQYVQLRGNFAADGSSFAASQIRLRSGNNLPDADLSGTVIGYDAVAKTFTVRGVTVRMGSTVPSGCPAVLSGQYVEVSGRIGLGGVDASSIGCQSAPPAAVIERRGTAGNTVLINRSFALTEGGSTTPVRWTPLTFFGDDLGRSPDALNGRRLRVEGVLVNGVLVATKIRLDS